MSDSFDKFFRDQQLNIPEATPPPGQWERILNQEMVLETSGKRPRSFWPLLLLSLLVGLGAGVVGGAYFFVADCPTGVTGTESFATGQGSGGNTHLPIHPEPAIEQDTNYLHKGGPLEGITQSSGEMISKVVESPATLTFPAPASSPENTKTPVPQVLLEQTNDTKEIAFDRKVLMKSSVEKTKDLMEGTEEMINSGLLSSASEGGVQGKTLKRQSEVDDKVFITNPLVLSTVNTTKPVASNLFGSAQSTLVSAAVNAPINSPEKISDRKPQQKGKWEIGGHAMPWLSRNTTAVQIYSAEPNGRQGRGLSLKL